MTANSLVGLDSTMRSALDRHDLAAAVSRLLDDLPAHVTTRVLEGLSPTGRFLTDIVKARVGALLGLLLGTLGLVIYFLIAKTVLGI